MPRPNTRPFDMANYLTSEDDVVMYLDLVLQDGGPAELVGALGPIACARAMTALPAATGLARESLYRSLSGERPPSSGTPFVVRPLDFTRSASSSKPNAAPGGGSG
ncbi:putative addiction module antidote protein [Variovorax paradoxus]|nr:addiction module antidote protein [Variovorax paradoxus]MBT2305320.1 putative addiction module antidote protein [Variovorax paradoxus]